MTLSHPQQNKDRTQNRHNHREQQYTLIQQQQIHCPITDSRQSPRFCCLNKKNVDIDALKRMQYMYMYIVT